MNAERDAVRMVIADQPSPEDQAAVLAPLRAYNLAAAGDARTAPVAILLRDAGDATIGGLWGKTSYDWMFVEYLAVPETLRGQDIGTALMREAERIARSRGCVGIWLDTFAFQARAFYEKLGFSVFGTLDDHPVGSRRFFLSKRLSDPA
ncbi:MAG TPA: GNAT family N-acetyltransferase [Sphingomonas sp.]|jgi:GNAT superfamily N-acetyltransferase|uniref:GNAT family N-acetyltransferase n=1 Tax=Sphingomonas sp. TaxID=28214 RepID=UPI002ED83A62